MGYFLNELQVSSWQRSIVRETEIGVAATLLAAGSRQFSGLLRSATMLNAVTRASSGILRTVQPAAGLAQLQNGASKVLPTLSSNRE